MKKIAEILKSANGLAIRNANFNRDLQTLLVDAAEHAFDTSKNVDALRQVVIKGSAFRFTGIDNAVLIAWIEKYTPARWDNKELKFRFNKSFNGDFDRELLMANPWHKKAKKPTAVSSSIDYLDMVRSFIKRMEKEAAVEVDGAPRKVEHAELLIKLQTIANAAEYAEAKGE
jgi:hypothetical protein